MNNLTKVASALIIGVSSAPIALSGAALAMGGGHGGVGGMAAAGIGAAAGLGGASGLGAGVSASASAGANASAGPLSAVTTAGTNVSGAIDAATASSATADNSDSGNTAANDPSRPQGHRGFSKSQATNDAARTGSGHHSRAANNEPKSTTSMTAASHLNASTDDGSPQVSGTASAGANVTANSSTQE